MKNNNKRLNGVHIWKEFEDLMVPRLRLTVYERAAYSHLLRHSRLDGKLRICLSIRRLAQGAGLTERAVCKALQGLAGKRALRLKECSRAGYVLEARLPEEIREVRAGKIVAEAGPRASGKDDLEKADCLARRELREAIYEREGGRCFYCSRRVTPMTRCLDHVVPRFRKGSSTYRNMVTSCVGCNSQKRERRAGDFVRWLYREGHLTAAEFRGRLRALKALAAGKLRPALPGQP